MDRFDDVSVVASVDETPPAPRVPRRARRAFTGVVAAVVVTGALAGAAVGLADEKAEPSAAPSATDSFPAFKRSGHGCKGKHGARTQRSSAMRY